jgi:hypothetical protein
MAEKIRPRSEIRSCVLSGFAVDSAGSFGVGRGVWSDCLYNFNSFSDNKIESCYLKVNSNT